MIRVALVGFGNVGRSLALVLDEMQSRYPIKVVAASSSRGSVVLEGDGYRALIELARSGWRLDMHPGFKAGLGPVDAAVESRASVAMVTIPPSYDTGEPNRSIYKGLIGSGVSIITADKTVLARWFKEFTELARSSGLYLGYRATVAAGIPAIDVARGLRGRSVKRIVAVLNSTTNYLITLVRSGLSYNEAVEKAVREQLAEPDPRIDTHGLDPAAKIAILSSTLGYEASIDMVERIPLDEVLESVEGVERLRRGEVLRYLAIAEPGEGVYAVKPAWLPREDPLAGVEGIYNGIVFEVEGERITLTGPVGPAWRTARVMATDLIEYMEVVGVA